LTTCHPAGQEGEFVVVEYPAKGPSLKTYPGIKECPHAAIRLGRILRRTFLYNGRAKATLIPIAAPESVSLCADEKLTAFLELEWAIRACGKLA
jgi:hypothetical protein